MARSFGAESLGADGFAVRGPTSAAPTAGSALIELGGHQLGWTARPVVVAPQVAPSSNSDYLSPVGWTPVPVVDLSSRVAKAGDTMTAALKIVPNSTHNVTLGGADGEGNRLTFYRSNPNLQFNGFGLGQLIFSGDESMSGPVVGGYIFGLSDGNGTYYYKDSPATRISIWLTANGEPGPVEKQVYNSNGSLSLGPVGNRVRLTPNAGGALVIQSEAGPSYGSVFTDAGVTMGPATVLGSMLIKRTATGNPVDNNAMVTIEHQANGPYPYAGLAITHRNIGAGNYGGSFIAFFDKSTARGGFTFDYLDVAQGSMSYAVSDDTSFHAFKTGTTERARISNSGLTVSGSVTGNALRSTGGVITYGSNNHTIVDNGSNGIFMTVAGQVGVQIGMNGNGSYLGGNAISFGLNQYSITNVLDVASSNLLKLRNSTNTGWGTFQAGCIIGQDLIQCTNSSGNQFVEAYCSGTGLKAAIFAGGNTGFVTNSSLFYIMDYNYVPKSMSAGSIDSTTSGHTDSYTWPGNAIAQAKFTNDGGSLGLHHHYYPAQSIDRWVWRVTPNSAAGVTASKHLAIGYLYGNAYVDTDMGLGFQTAGLYLMQYSNLLLWQHSATSVMDWYYPSMVAGDSRMQFSVINGLRFSDNIGTIGVQIQTGNTYKGVRLSANDMVRFSSTAGANGVPDAQLGRHTSATIGVYADSGLVVRNNTNSAYSVLQAGGVIAAGTIRSNSDGSNDLGASSYRFRDMWLSGTLTQGAQDARWTVPSAGQRSSQVGNGSGTWQTGYREAYNVSGVQCSFYGASLVGQQSIASTATDAASTQALANSLRTAIINLGLGV